MPRLISIAILTKNGGDAFREVLEALRRQTVPESWATEVVLLDSGSTDDTLAAAREAGAVIHEIPPEDFSFGESRDVLFSHCRGEIIATLSQDACPVGTGWLEAITEPIRAGRADVVQGWETLSDKPFFWERIGRFYATSEWRPFFERYGWSDVPGLSTVNLAVRRSVWEETGFGPIPMCSDKLFQKRVFEAEKRVELRRDAVVRHGHEYRTRSLFKRCANEGMALRRLGFRVSARRTVRDALNRRNYGALIRGVARGEVRSPAEALFPVLRPLGVWYGNRFLSDYWR